MDYTNGGKTGGSNGDNNERQDVTLKVTPYAAIDYDLDSAFRTNGQWGQSLAVTGNNAVLVDGGLYERTSVDQEPDTSNTFKVFSWQQLGFTDDMDFDASDAPKVYSENYNKTYGYTLVDARHDETAEDEEYPEIGSIIMWEGATEDNGPASASKTSARVLTQKGRDAIVDEGDWKNWLAEGVQLRDELEGRRVRYYKIEREGEEYSFYSPVFIDLALDEQLTIKNASDESSTDSESEEAEAEPEPEVEPEPEAEAEPEPEPAAAQTDGGFSEQIQEFINFCREQEITAESAVLKTLNTMVTNPASSVDEEMVEGREDDIVAAVQAAEVAA